ncbi:MAG: glycosyltransferase family 39 protein [Lachnospiraceae bacterium]|nr:glycosyltransferase family 39 protein [Lachnospiraceae bacterium]
MSEKKVASKNFVNKLFENRLLLTAGCALLAVGVIILNWSLAFDNVVWGDEAFSSTVVRDADYAGILQRIYYWDNHPPLYYFWLKTFSLIFGNHIPVYHAASLVPFTGCVILALFPVRRKFGEVPAAFMIAIMGLSSVTAEYNLEIRMYELCFFFIFVTFLFGLKALENGKPVYWIFLTVFSVLAAYTHYFGLVTGGLILFFVSLIYFLRCRGKSWLYGVISVVGFFVLYSPWLYVLLSTHISATAGDNWLDVIEPVGTLAKIIFCGDRLYPVLLPATVVFAVFAYAMEIRAHGIRRISVELMGITVGIAVIVSTLAFTYLTSYVITTITVGRYMYPLVPVMLFVLSLSINRFMHFAKLSDKETTGETVIALLFLVIFAFGLLDFKNYRTVVKVEDAVTKETLETVGEPGKDALFVGAGVKHLSWTVLKHYYPNNEIAGNALTELPSYPSEIWAFLGYEVDAATESFMAKKGYSTQNLGTKQLGKYTVRLYHYYK